MKKLVLSMYDTAAQGGRFFIENFGSFLVATLVLTVSTIVFWFSVMFAVSGLVHFLMADFSMEARKPIFYLVSFMLMQFFGAGLLLGYYKWTLDLYDTGKACLNTLFSYFHMALRGMVATLFYVGMVVVGLCFFLFPGIYIALRLGYYAYFIVDKNVGAIESLQKSWELTEKRVGYVLGIEVLVGLLKMIPLINFLLFGFGSATWIVAYRNLLAQKQGYVREEKE